MGYKSLIEETGQEYRYILKMILINGVSFRFLVEVLTVKLPLVFRKSLDCIMLATAGSSHVSEY